MRVLIAEDDAVSCLRLQRAIEKLGHECLVAPNGQRAWEIFCAEEIDTVVTDRVMPGIDGTELCRRVREYAQDGRYTYFIFLTALSNKAQLLSGMTEGADDYLMKPLDTFELDVRLKVADRVTSLYRTVAGQQAESDRLNAELFEQSRLDPLTHLGNRLRMGEDLEQLQGRESPLRGGHDQRRGGVVDPG